ncbi:LPS assembly lipoprotein LptE [Pontibacter silvestris]|uniref:LPS assembly lipoprotein LptE n=1 Tax=Pontibacter silvestris TaxID=2305183 RepID=A0ABW4X0G3_9BACT|nr:LptE family protein [Pontibacter silvestris]MCC9138237.1 LPS assembly lipoprotein LptE [Pontibacter silvestris]
MTLKNKTSFFATALSLLLVICSSCGIYSFSGTTISPDIKSMSIQTIENSTGEGPSNLTDIVTTTFKNYYRRNTNLTVIQAEGDLQLAGQIVSFTYSPAAIEREGQQDQASLNRLTLGIQVRFTNTKDPQKDFDRLFTISENFEGDVDITQIPAASITSMTERLVTDVFNKTVADW